MNSIIEIIEMFTWYDWGIFIYGTVLIFAHLIGVVSVQPSSYKWLNFIAKNNEIYRNFLYQLTELLPVMALIGTVYGLLVTFSSLDLTAAEGMQAVVKKFGIAMTATFVGLGFSLLNLLANAFLWFAWQQQKEA